MVDQHSDDQKKINLDPFKNHIVVGPLGRGSQGWALKIIDKQVKGFTKIKSRIDKEVEIHKKLDHQNIIKLYTVYDQEQHVCMLLENAECEDLHQYIQQKGKLQEDEIRNLALQLAQGIKYLHDQNIIHRDLKLANIVLKDDYTKLKICDFGLAVMLTDDQPERDTLCGTPNYLSPEVVNKQSYGKSIDCWAYGCIVYSMLVGKPPFENQTVQEVLQNVKNADIIIPANCSSGMRALLQMTLQRDCNLRLSIDDIINHSFFEELRKEKQIVQFQTKNLKQSCQSDFIQPLSPELKLSDLQDINSPSQKYNIYSQRNDFFYNPSYHQQKEKYNPSQIYQRKYHSKQNSITSMQNLSKKSDILKQFFAVEPSTQLHQSERTQYIQKSHGDYIQFVQSYLQQVTYNLQPKLQKNNCTTAGIKRKHQQQKSAINSKQAGLDSNNYSACKKNLFGSDEGKENQENQPINKQKNEPQFIRSQSTNNTTKNKSIIQKERIPLKIQQLSTSGIKPTKLSTKNGVIEINSQGFFILIAQNENIKFQINQDGSKQQNEKIYHLNNLPSKYCKLYQYAYEVCNTLKSKCIMQQIQNSHGNFAIMMDKPPTFEGNFENGYKVSHKVNSSIVKVYSPKTQQKLEINLKSDTSLMDSELNQILKLTLKYLTECLKCEQNQEF